MPSSQLSSLIQWHRKRSGLSQSALAEHAGVSRYVVQDLEAGHERTTLGKLLSVLEVLNLSLEPDGPLVSEWKAETRQDS